MHAALRLLLVILLVPFCSVAQQLYLVKDLIPEALKFDDGDYTAAKLNEDLTTYYFRVESGTSGEYVQINSVSPYALFVNGKLCASGITKGLFKVDSLREKFAASELLLAVHHTAPDRRMSAALLTVKPTDASGPDLRPSTSFRDFVVIAMLALMSLFVVLIRLNPKLTSDYFSITKIFTLREMDDAQLYTRITSSSNILFYVFCSLLAGFSITTIFQFTHVGGDSGRETFGFALWDWVSISTIILFIFFLKILLVYSLSALFGLRGIGRVHFFYWIRVLLMTACAATLVLFLYFVMRGNNISVYDATRWGISVVLFSMTILIFLKLMRRAECSIFHLFSYICATELIPFLITVKLLFQ